MDARVLESPARIDLRIFQTGTFRIYRKDPYASSWGPAIATVTNTTRPSVWSDTNVEIGRLYEYGIGTEDSTFPNVFGNVLTGIRVDQTQSRGRFAIVVAEDILTRLPNEYAQYKADVAADGWTIHEIVTPRAPDYQNSNAGTNALATVSVTAGGSAYTTSQQVTLSNGTSTALATLTANQTTGVITSVAVNYGNSGFTVGQTLTMAGNTTGTGAVLTVATVRSGSPEHVNIRNQLIALNNQFPGELKNVVLVGKVAVPRSGVGYVGPDGHGNRVAVGADAYYADMDGVWTDTGSNLSWYPAGQQRTAAVSEGRINLPGDWKFDATYLTDIQTPNSRVELGFGRIDLSNEVPGEYEAMRMYFNKLHRYKVAAADFKPGRKVLNRMNAPPTGDTVQTAMLRNMPGLVGMEDIDLVRGVDVDAVPQDSSALSPEDRDAAYTRVNGPYLFAFKGSGGPGRSGDSRAVFWTGLQSHWGYWFLSTTSGTNSMQLRLAEDNMTLSYTWSIWGTDYLYFRMAMGLDMGDVMRVTLNDRSWSSYLYPVTSTPGGLFMNHMGCPSLRVFMFEPPTDLSVIPNGGQATLSWTASTASGVIGYHVYRSNSATGPFTRLTSSPISATTYTDASVNGGTWHYQVKAIRLETSGSGTFLNPSLAAQRSVDLTNPPSAPTVTTNALPPVPWNTPYEVQLSAANGTPVYTWTLVSGSLPPGLSLSPAGVISGTATASGTYSFTAQATDRLGMTAQKAFGITANSERATTIWAEAGQWVSGLNTTRGAGSAASMMISGPTYLYQAFLRFNLSDLNTNNRFVRARLVLTVDERSQPNSYALLRTALTKDEDDGWSETALTFAERPKDDPNMPVVPAASTAVAFQTVEFDVTSLVRETLKNDPAKKLSLRLFTTFGNGFGNEVRFATRFATPNAAPRLIIETTDAPQIALTSPSISPAALHVGTSLSIEGTVTPIPARAGSVTMDWTRVSGPGTVSFSNPSQVNTSATFSASGDYVLRLTARDGVLTSYQDVMVRVLDVPAATTPVVGPTDGLILRLPFDETTGTTASDFSLAPARNGSFATLGATGLPTFVSGGKVGGAVNFDGSGQRVEVLDSPEKPLDGMQKLTVSFWFKMTVAEAKARALVVKRTSSNAATTSFSISLTSGQRLSVSVANRTAVSGDNVLVADQWYHVVMVYDGSLATNNLKLYLDGNPEKFGTMTSGEANNAVPRISASRLRVGDYTATSITTTSTGPFNGQVDELRLYNRALSQDEILDLALATPSNLGPRITLAQSTVSGATGQQVPVSATVSDDGMPQAVQVTWSKAAGPGSVVFSDPVSASTTASTATPGSYGLRITATDGSITTFADVSASFESTGGLSAWRQQHFGTTENTGNAADSANPQGDGLRNLLKYALGLNPNVNYSDSPIAPKAQAENIGGQDYLTYTFTRDTAVTDATIMVEAANELTAAQWTAIDPLNVVNQVSVQENTPSPGIQTIKVRDSQPIPANGRRFLRLRVSNP